MPPLLAGQRPLCCFAELHRQELDSLAVHCKYGASEYGTKAWCRRDQTRCKIWATTDDFLSWTNKKALEGRVWMQDNPQQRTVTITMQKLQARDTGVYWCVLYTSTHPSRIMEVKLSVSKREYPPAAQGGCWEISAPPPLLVLPPALRHPEEQHCCRAADTHVSACLSLWRTRWQLPLGRRSPSSGPSYSVCCQQRLGRFLGSLEWGPSSQRLLPEQLPRLSPQLLRTGHCWRPAPCQASLLLCPTAACPPCSVPPRATG